MPIVGVPATVAAIYNTAAGQSIPNATDTIVNFGTKVQDTHDAVTTGAAWKFTAPAAGFYQVSAQILFAGTTGWADTEWGVLTVRVNGVNVCTVSYRDSYSSASTVYMQLGGSTLVYLNAGDTVAMRIFQNSGAALALIASDVNNYISIVKV